MLNIGGFTILALFYIKFDMSCHVDIMSILHTKHTKKLASDFQPRLLQPKTYVNKRKLHYVS